MAPRAALGSVLFRMHAPRVPVQDLPYSPPDAPQQKNYRLEDDFAFLSIVVSCS
jgi:hypothetical protein